MEITLIFAVLIRYIMTRFLTLTLFLLTSLGLWAQTDTPLVQASFDPMFIELGEMTKGDTRDTVFTFTNTGKETLEIEIVSACECTTLDWTRGPIAPGETGKIDVHFDSSEKEQSETVEIDVNFVNTNPDTGGPYWLILEYSFEFVE